MNEQTEKLIEQLAQKLGTTADYLWSVLLRQAHISAITDLIYLALLIIVGVVIFKAHKKFFSKEKGSFNYYDYNSGELLIAIMGLVSLVWAMVFVVCLFSIGDIINGFFSPEYWALEKVLSLIK